MEFWMNPFNLESYDVAIEIRSTLQQFLKIIFTPLYKFKNLVGQYDEDFLKKNCFSKGKFCATNNENFDSDSILLEGVRQICIWKTSELTKNSNKFWWDYITLYRDCLSTKISDPRVITQHCSEYIFGKLNTSIETQNVIKKCMEQSFDQGDFYLAENSLLKENMNNEEYSDVFLVPALFIDGAMERETISARMITSALCSAVSSKPDICYSDMFQGLEMDYQESGIMTILTILVVIALIIVLLVVVFIYVKRLSSQSMADEIQKDIKDHVTEYMKISDRN